MSIFNDLSTYCNNHKVDLVAVSKTKPNEAILELYEQGQRVFGENKVQELTAKQEALPGDIDWHMIGHLQTNKVKYIAPFVSMIHSGDRLSLLKEINKSAVKNDRTIDVLLQIKIAEEDSKFGWNISELLTHLESGQINQYQNINVRGVMGMATFTDNTQQVKTEFTLLKSYFDQISASSYATKLDFDTISMGMSGDYKLAVESGSTMIRVGSLLFGSRA